MKATKTALILYTGIISTMILFTAGYAFFSNQLSGFSISEVLKLLLSVIGIYAAYDFVKNRFEWNHRLLLIWWLPQIIYLSNNEYNHITKTVISKPIIKAVMAFDLSFTIGSQNLDGSYSQLHINFLAATALMVIYKLLSKDQESKSDLREKEPSLQDRLPPEN